MRNAGGRGGQEEINGTVIPGSSEGCVGCPGAPQPGVTPVSPPVGGLTERGDCLADNRRWEVIRAEPGTHNELRAGGRSGGRGGHCTFCGDLGAGPVLVGWGGEVDDVGATILLLSC